MFPAICARGYSLEGPHWTLNRTVVMHLSLGGPAALQDGFPSFNDSAADALSMWNRNLTHMQFAWDFNAPLTPAQDDADNSAFFSADAYGEAFGNRVLAVTLYSARGSILTESDTLFNNHYTFNSYRGPLQSGVLDFHRIALHEFGHALGLDHPDEHGQTVNAVMNSVISDTDALTSDDIAGAGNIYGSGPAYRYSNPSTNLVNLSTRALVGTGANVLIGGIIIQGSQPATVILRAIGHSLAARGVSNPLLDPTIELHNSSGTVVAQSDDWVDSPDATTIASYRLDPSNSRESALYQTLSPGNYTAIVKAFDNGDGNVTGTGLVELYDLHTAAGGIPGSNRAGNISARGQVSTGDDVMIAGFIIGGNVAKEVVVRGLGPSLQTAGISNALSNPTIELHNSSGAIIATNDNWQTDQNSARVQQSGLAPTVPVESALDRTLNPGTYTLILRGVNSGTGIGLIEVYDLSPPP